ncbi:MAG: formylglycine-generating enzyme family protein [Verrucomicrobiales bacterium]|nr:formylglycine-generating enzyme family protein [Verrucomicrobiales bacterium]
MDVRSCSCLGLVGLGCSILVAVAADAPVRGTARLLPGSGIEISWDSIPGRDYLVEATPALTAPWQVDPFGPGVLRATGETLVATVGATGQRQFFRIVALPSEPPNPAPDELVWIPPGTFMMGTPGDETAREDYEGPQTRVTLTRGYWLGKYEVTIDQYREFLLAGGDPGGVAWTAANCPIKQDETFSLSGTLSGRRGDLPMCRINWAGAVVYCDWRTEVARQEGTLPEGYVFALPTEAQWEHACRAGTTTRYSFGDTPDCDPISCGVCAALADYCWFCGNSGQKSQPVGLKQPNPWGLYDMHGNVWEWTNDWWDWTLPGGALVDPLGPEGGTFRTRHGGSWATFPKQCRSGHRYGGTPVASLESLGMRLALVPIRER